MPTNKDLKRLVRTRMQKTGESYTSARAHLIKHKPTPPAAAPAPLGPADLERLAGMSNEAVKAKTGCDWNRWVSALDRHGAAELPHREIARLVHEKYKIGDWWTQTVTVGYERIRGLRAIGQRRDGAYEASKSRTLPAAAPVVYRAFRDVRVRRRWLEAPVTIRAAQPGKSLRLGMDDGTIVGVYLTAKGKAKTAVAIQHMKLKDKAAADRLKGLWAERLGALAGVLAE
jgi:hypothetical protein